MPISHHCVRQWIGTKPMMSYCQTSSISGTKSHKIKRFSSRLAVVFAQSIEARRQVGNKDIVGAAPTGDAPTPSE